MSFSAAGLLIAAIMSGTNIFTDVARKKAVHNRALVPATFWCQVSAALVFGIVIAVRLFNGSQVIFRDGGALFGVSALHLSPAVTYFVYLIIDVLLVSVANLLYFRALQVSPLSLCVPFLAFTPIFLIPTGFLMLGELPAAAKLLGVVLVVAGSLFMHRRLFALGWMAPIKAIFREKGSRYMLIVAFIFSVTNPLEKKLVLISDVYTQSLAYGIGLCLFFLILALARREDLVGAAKGNMWWILAAGIMDGVSLLLQFASYHYIDVVISISIKRAGIVLAVLFGWLFFREHEITDKIIGSSVMLMGVLIIYLPVASTAAILITCVSLAAAGMALYLTRRPKPALQP